jgi:hypothetical protein
MIWAYREEGERFYIRVDRFSIPTTLSTATGRRRSSLFHFVPLSEIISPFLPPPRRDPRPQAIPPAAPLSAISLPFAARGAAGADYTVSRRSVSHELGIEQVNESFPRLFRVIIERADRRVSSWETRENSPRSHVRARPKRESRDEASRWRTRISRDRWKISVNPQINPHRYNTESLNSGAPMIS